MLSTLELKILASYISENLEIKLEEIVERIVNNKQANRISQRKAQNLYGRTKLENWRSDGLIRRYKTGNRYEYEVKELEKLNKQSIIKVKL